MAEDFQATVCSGSWWMSPRSNFSRSWCSSVLSDMDNFGPFLSRDLIMDMKPKSSDNKSSDGSMIFHDIQKPSGIMSPDSALQFMATTFSSSPPATTTDHWNQNLLLKVQEELNTFPTSGDHDDSTAVTEADQHQDFTMDQQQSFNCTTTFPVSSTSYEAYPSTLLQSFLDNNSPPPPPPPPLQQLHQQPPYTFHPNSNDLNFILKQHVPGNLHLTNNTPFWNASGSTLDDNISSYFSSLSSQFLPSSYKEKESRPNLIIKRNHQEIRDMGSSAKKCSGELPLKRPRLETPSPLPTFKVRKEKLGDRITALQQLVSPFGKTDTASVLHEAIDYIKLLHDQVNILSAPYIKNGATKQLQHIDHDQKVKNAEAHKQDLRSLGLCLVPVSSTFPVANGTATGFWTPSYEGSFR